MSPQKSEIKKTKLSTAVGQRLLQVRKSHNYTIEKMAGLMRVRDWTYRSNEKGHNVPNAYSLCQLSRQLNVSLDWLLTGRGSMYHTEPAGTKEGGEKSTAASYGFLKRELQDMIYTMERVPLVYHSVLGYYEEVKRDNSEFISLKLEEAESAEGKDTSRED